MTEHYSNSLHTKQKITDFSYHYLQYLQYNAENLKRAFTQCTHLVSQTENKQLRTASGKQNRDKQVTKNNPTSLYQ